MADLPILFSAPMVRAILREIERPGTGKTQTRRVINPQPVVSENGSWSWEGRNGGFVGAMGTHVDEGFPESAKHWNRIQPGDRLYVREAHHRTNDSADSHLVGYDFADGPVTREDRHHVEGVGDVQFFRHSLGGWGGRTSRNYPAMHMPRWASRITLIVTDVRVQRLQEIDEVDSCAEGVRDGYGDPYHEWEALSYRRRFNLLWDHLNAARGYGWDANPWVAAYTFRPVLGNIDQVRP